MKNKGGHPLNFSKKLTPPPPANLSPPAQMPSSIEFKVLVWDEMETYTITYEQFCDRVLDIPSSLCKKEGAPWDMFNRVRSLAVVRPFVTNGRVSEQNINMLLRGLCRIANYQRKEENVK